MSSCSHWTIRLYHALSLKMLIFVPSHFNESLVKKRYLQSSHSWISWHLIVYEVCFRNIFISRILQMVWTSIPTTSLLMWLCVELRTEQILWPPSGILICWTDKEAGRQMGAVYSAQMKISPPFSATPLVTMQF